MSCALPAMLVRTHLRRQGKVRVLFVITSLGLGGAERQVMDVADRLAANGHTVTVANLTGQVCVQPVDSRIRVVPLGMSKTLLGFVLGYFRLLQLVRNCRPDVVHSHMVHANLLCRLVRLCVFMPRLVCTAHSTNEGGRLRMFLYRLTDGLADISTNVSHDAVTAFEALGAVPRGSMLAVPNGIDCKRFRPDATMRQEVRRTAGIDGNQRIILAVGRFDLAKDYPNLLNAFGQVVNKIPEARLWIAGDGPLRCRMEGLSNELGLSGTVSFLGARNDVPNLMRAADVFVLSSAWEGFGLVVAEAMASELRVVATDCGGVREVLGGAGFLVPPRNPMALSLAMERALALSPTDARALGRKARERVLEQYSLERAVEEWERIYADTPPMPRVR